MGFQYHFELTEAGIEALVSNRKEDVTRVLGSDGEAKIREGTKKNYPRYERLGNRILNNYVQFLKAYDPIAYV
jgi:hypothetical protein